MNSHTTIPQSIALTITSQGHPHHILRDFTIGNRIKLLRIIHFMVGVRKMLISLKMQEIWIQDEKNKTKQNKMI